jgi:hypothetical protein
MRANQRTEFEWRRVVAIASALAMAAAVIAFGVTGCGGGGGGGGTLTVDAPGVPTAFTVERTPEVTLSATLTWSPPTTGGDPATFEIYRSTTASTAFLPDNHVISMPAVSGQVTPYTFIDNAGLTPVDTYWVVSAKNAGGETPTGEVLYKPIGSGGGEDEAYGNNFSAALVFADDIGIGGLAIGATSVWTNDLTTPIDYNTGLRPTLEQVTALAALLVPVTTMPYLDPATTFPLGGVTYYKQQTASTWQGQWVRGAAEAQHVTAKWGDNLISQRFTANSVIRIEMVLSKALTTAMKSYTMKSLYGTQRNEIFGSDGTTYDNLTAFVFAANAHLKIAKLDDSGVAVHTPYDQTLWMGDGPGFLAGEVNVGGNFTYGFVWDLKSEVMPVGVPKTGTWRITFSLDGTSPKGTSNNTFIDSAANGVYVDGSTVFIDILVQ